MDVAGYCFGSVLGPTVFDNEGCIGTSVSLGPEAKVLAARIRGIEAVQGCWVDTSATNLDLGAIWIRRHLVDQPVRDIFESACLGWLGPAVPLNAGRDRSLPAVGQIAPGSNVSNSHEPEGNWSFVTVSGPDWVPVSGGWMDREATPEACAQIAG